MFVSPPANSVAGKTYTCAMNQIRNKLLAQALAAACAAGVLAGCGSSSTSPFERFERLPTIEQLVTVELGEYVVPVPVEVAHSSSPVAATQLQIEFFLHAAVLPEHQRTLEKNYERLEGRFRDMVIEVCRNTPVEDLTDPHLTALKAHLADSLKPYIGDAQIERIHIADPQLKRL